MNARYRNPKEDQRNGIGGGLLHQAPGEASWHYLRLLPEDDILTMPLRHPRAQEGLVQNSFIFVWLGKLCRLRYH